MKDGEGLLTKQEAQMIKKLIGRLWTFWSTLYALTGEVAEISITLSQLLQKITERKETKP